MLGCDSFFCKLERFWLTKHRAWRKSPTSTISPRKHILHQIRHEEWERREVGILASLECSIDATKSCWKNSKLQCKNQTLIKVDESRRKRVTYLVFGGFYDIVIEVLENRC